MSHITNKNFIIKKVEVKKLFGCLDYEFKPNKDLSFILAPNGFGKTTVLNLINFLLEPTYNNYLMSVENTPFKYIKIFFTNGVTYTLNKTGESQFIFTSEPNKLKFNLNLHFNDLAFNIEWQNAGRPVHPSALRNKKYKEFVQDKLEKLNLFLLDNKLPSYLTPGKSKVLYFNTSRTFTEKGNDEVADDTLGDHITQLGSIYYCAERFNILHNEAIDYYNNHLSKVGKNKNLKNINDLSFNRYSSIYNTCKKLNEPIDSFVLIPKGYGWKFPNFFVEKDYIKLSKEAKIEKIAYLESFASIFLPLFSFREKILLFKTIIDNKKFYQKSLYLLEYTNEEGPLCFKRNNKYMPSGYLSSGEKHIFTMYFNLIFNADLNTIVLIDEPEISLNINWQLNFITDVIKAIKGKGCQIIVATHSPQIISDYASSIIRVKKYD